MRTDKSSLRLVFARFVTLDVYTFARHGATYKTRVKYILEKSSFYCGYLWGAVIVGREYD